MDDDGGRLRLGRGGGGGWGSNPKQPYDYDDSIRFDSTIRQTAASVKGPY